MPDTKSSKSNKNKSKKKKYFLVIGGIILLLILRTAFCGKKNPPITVQTEKVTKRTITQIVTGTGKINPVNQVVITPEVTGEIVTLPVKEGDKVQKGQLLIKIKPDTYMAQRERAKANLDSARANLKMRKVELTYIQAEYDRVTNLLKNGVANQQQMEKAQSDLSSALAQQESMNAAVSQAEAALKEADESLYKTTIYSPMDGTVSQLNVELGERVLGSGFSQGTNLMTVADLNQMEAVIEVDENDVVLISVGDKTKIQIDAFKEKTFTGAVSQIGNSAKTKGEGTQELIVNFEIKIALDKTPEGEAVRPGMSCNADIETETRENVLSVPIMSVTARSPEDDKKLETEQTPREDETQVLSIQKAKARTKPQEVVFIVKDQKAVIKKVKTGISDDNYIEISEGLLEGEEVISGSYKAISKELKDGAKVQVNNETKSITGTK
ncbi:MAG TPA: efflux RND transporter periplasmic adaptor subunit [Candidatus Deferrimicrobium sp.]|nr:efflux RND transporter periplasmic adaptor subunit [Candidatus Deferrimicrobium sp.]